MVGASGVTVDAVVDDSEVEPLSVPQAAATMAKAVTMSNIRPGRMGNTTPDRSGMFRGPDRGSAVSSAGAVGVPGLHYEPGCAQDRSFGIDRYVGRPALQVCHEDSQKEKCCIAETFRKRSIVTVESIRIHKRAHMYFRQQM